MLLCCMLLTCKFGSAVMQYNKEFCAYLLFHHTNSVKDLGVQLIEVFKILRGFENLDPDNFFQVSGYGIVCTWGS